MSDNVQQLKTDWEAETLDKTLNRFPERRSEFETEAHIRVERVYTPEDVHTDYARDLGFPGQYPFTRGVQPTMYRGRPFTSSYTRPRYSPMTPSEMS